MQFGNPDPSRNNERNVKSLTYLSRFPSLHPAKRWAPFIWKGETTMTKSRSLSEYVRAMLRATLASPGTAPAVFTNENVRGLLGADETCMTCPLCGTAAEGRVYGGKLCQEFRCDECGHHFAKST